MGDPSVSKQSHIKSLCFKICGSDLIVEISLIPNLIKILTQVINIFSKIQQIKK